MPPDADLVSAERGVFAPLLFSDEIASDTQRRRPSLRQSPLLSLRVP